APCREAIPHEEARHEGEGRADDPHPLRQQRSRQRGGATCEPAAPLRQGRRVLQHEDAEHEGRNDNAHDRRGCKAPMQTNDRIPSTFPARSPMTPDYWPEAKAHLSKKDRVLRKLIKTYPDAMLNTRGDAFQTLARSIVGQQISVKAAQSVWDRFALCAGIVTPQKVLELPAERLRACGLSGQ